MKLDNGTGEVGGGSLREVTSEQGLEEWEGASL